MRTPPSRAGVRNGDMVCQPRSFTEVVAMKRTNYKQEKRLKELEKQKKKEAKKERKENRDKNAPEEESMEQHEATE